MIYKTIAKKFPELKQLLLMARIEETPEEYIRNTVISSIYLSIGILIILFMFLKSFIVFAFFPIVLLFMFMFLFRKANQKIKYLDAEISKEIVFAGRFLIIELESGIPLFNTFRNIALNYKYVGLYFEMIVDKVNLGSGIEEAINETIDVCPSENLKKILWQILNSLKTGADISRSMNNVLENIVREQNIAVKEFGNKLNPLAMFYMMIAIIVPSLGITILIILASFMSLEINLLSLMIIAVFIGFMQFMFLMLIKNSRPNVEM